MPTLKMPIANSSLPFYLEASYGRNKYIRFLKTISGIRNRFNRCEIARITFVAKQSNIPVAVLATDAYFSKWTADNVLTDLDEMILGYEDDANVCLVSCYNEEAHGGQNTNPIIDVSTSWKAAPSVDAIPVFSGTLLDDLGVKLTGTSLKTFSRSTFEVPLGICPVSFDSYEITISSKDGTLLATLSGSGTYGPGFIGIRYYTIWLSATNGSSSYRIIPVYQASTVGNLNATVYSVRIAGSLDTPIVSFSGDAGMVTPSDYVAQASRLAFEILSYYGLVSIYRAEDQNESTTVSELLECDGYSVNEAITRERQGSLDQLMSLGRRVVDLEGSTTNLEDSIEDLDERVADLEQSSGEGPVDMDSLYVRG